jgi:hypothetical protein
MQADAHRTTRTHRRRSTAAVAVLAALVALSACTSSLRHDYDTFRSALDRGATCAELFDQRSRFKGAEELAEADADLARIGCTSREAERSD